MHDRNALAPTEKRPNRSAWRRVPTPMQSNPGDTLATSWWRCGDLVVASSLVNAQYPSGDGVGLQWTVSVSAAGRSTTRAERREALRAFDMLGAEEDNHFPGVARHYWKPLDPSRRVDCECKSSEVVVVEADGRRWTNPRDAPCRGCAFAVVSGRPCPIHTEVP